MFVNDQENVDPSRVHSSSHLREVKSVKKKGFSLTLSKTPSKRSFKENASRLRLTTVLTKTPSKRSFKENASHVRPIRTSLSVRQDLVPASSRKKASAVATPRTATKKKKIAIWLHDRLEISCKTVPGSDDQKRKNKTSVGTKQSAQSVHAVSIFRPSRVAEMPDQAPMSFDCMQPTTHVAHVRPGKMADMRLSCDTPTKASPSSCSDEEDVSLTPTHAIFDFETHSLFPPSPSSSIASMAFDLDDSKYYQDLGSSFNSQSIEEDSMEREQRSATSPSSTPKQQSASDLLPLSLDNSPATPQLATHLLLSSYAYACTAVSASSSSCSSSSSSSSSSSGVFRRATSATTTNRSDSRRSTATTTTNERRQSQQKEDRESPATPTPSVVQDSTVEQRVSHVYYHDSCDSEDDEEKLKKEQGPLPCIPIPAESVFLFLRPVFPPTHSSSSHSSRVPLPSAFVDNASPTTCSVSSFTRSSASSSASASCSVPSFSPSVGVKAPPPIFSLDLNAVPHLDDSLPFAHSRTCSNTSTSTTGNSCAHSPTKLNLDASGLYCLEIEAEEEGREGEVGEEDEEQEENSLDSSFRVMMFPTSMFPGDESPVSAASLSPAHFPALPVTRATATQHSWGGRNPSPRLAHSLSSSKRLSFGDKSHHRQHHIQMHPQVVAAAAVIDPTSSASPFLDLLHADEEMLQEYSREYAECEKVRLADDSLDSCLHWAQSRRRQDCVDVNAEKEEVNEEKEEEEEAIVLDDDVSSANSSVTSFMRQQHVFLDYDYYSSGAVDSSGSIYAVNTNDVSTVLLSTPPHSLPHHPAATMTRRRSSSPFSPRTASAWLADQQQRFRQGLYLLEKTRPTIAPLTTIATTTTTSATITASSTRTAASATALTIDASASVPKPTTTAACSDIHTPAAFPQAVSEKVVTLINSPVVRTPPPAQGHSHVALVGHPPATPPTHRAACVLQALFRGRQVRLCLSQYRREKASLLLRFKTEANALSLHKSASTVLRRPVSFSSSPDQQLQAEQQRREQLFLDDGVVAFQSLLHMSPSPEAARGRRQEHTSLQQRGATAVSASDVVHAIPCPHDVQLLTATGGASFVINSNQKAEAQLDAHLLSSLFICKRGDSLLLVDPTLRKTNRTCWPLLGTCLPVGGGHSSRFASSPRPVFAFLTQRVIEDRDVESVVVRSSGKPHSMSTKVGLNTDAPMGWFLCWFNDKGYTKRNQLWKKNTYLIPRHALSSILLSPAAQINSSTSALEDFTVTIASQQQRGKPEKEAERSKPVEMYFACLSAEDCSLWVAALQHLTFVNKRMYQQNYSEQ